MSRHYHSPDLDSPFWWFVSLVKLVAWLILARAWLLWALIALPIAGVATLRHNDDLAQRMVGSLDWKPRKGRRGSRRV